jgi:predicted lipoprotein with Yx(FWY)xxD motif
MILFRRAGATGALVAAVLLVGACGSSKSTATGSTATTKAAAPATVGVRTTSLGSIAVDASGKTLYQFDKDTAGSGTSACTGACATMRSSPAPTGACN